MNNVKNLRLSHLNLGRVNMLGSREREREMARRGESDRKIENAQLSVSSNRDN